MRKFIELGGYTINVDKITHYYSNSGNSPRNWQLKIYLDDGERILLNYDSETELYNSLKKLKMWLELE